MKRSREESDAAPPSTTPSRLPFNLHQVSSATHANVKHQVLALVYGNKRACTCMILFLLLDLGCHMLSSLVPSYPIFFIPIPTFF